MNTYNSSASLMFHYIPQVLGPTWFAMGTGAPNALNAVYAVDTSNVYVGGNFANIGGDTNKKYIAKWDGVTWRTMGTGTNSTVWAIYAIDNSNVYVGGEFFDIGGDTNKISIAKWDGTTWQRMTTINSFINGGVFAISAKDNSNVYIGGDFPDIGGDINKAFVAKWTGTTWARMGSGTSDAAGGGVAVSAISAYDNSNVYIGGRFADIGGDTSKFQIAKWNGATWTRMGSGAGTFGAGVNAISSYDNSNVYVAGFFGTVGGDRNKSLVAKWDGTTWRAMGTGVTGSSMNAILALDNSNVYFGGNFTNVFGDTNKKHIVEWDGSTWQSVNSTLNTRVNALGYANQNLYVGGAFTNIDGNVNKSRIVRTPINYVPPVKGMTWIAMGGALQFRAWAISAYDSSNVYVGGDFTNIGGDTNKQRIAKWDGTTWQRMGTGTNNPVYTVYAKDNSNVYIGGAFTSASGVGASYVARWDGATWRAMGGGTDGTTRFISAVDNSNVYVGGYFPSIGRDTNKKGIARWDGTTWRTMSSGIPNNVYAVLALDNSNVYVGATFINLGGDPNKNYIVRWDGATWRAMGAGTSGRVYGISAVDNSNVYVGGEFANIGGDLNKSNIAKWDGTTWQRMGTGITFTNSFVMPISVYDNSNVYVGGLFSSIGGDTFKSCNAKWDGTTWQRMGAGITGGVSQLNAISALNNSNVYVGGYFTDIGGDTKKAYISKWTNNY